LSGLLFQKPILLLRWGLEMDTDALLTVTHAVLSAETQVALEKVFLVVVNAQDYFSCNVSAGIHVRMVGLALAKY
jgi:hypothetical protein